MENEGIQVDERAKRVFGRSRVFGDLGSCYWTEGYVFVVP